MSACRDRELDPVDSARDDLAAVRAALRAGPLGDRAPQEYFAARARHEPNAAILWSAADDPNTWTTAAAELEGAAATRWLEWAERGGEEPIDVDHWIAATRPLALLAEQAAAAGYCAYPTELAAVDLHEAPGAALAQRIVHARISTFLRRGQRDDALREIVVAIERQYGVRPRALVDWLLAQNRLVEAWRLAAEGAWLWSPEQIERLLALPVESRTVSDACWSDVIFTLGSWTQDPAFDPQEGGFATQLRATTEFCQALDHGGRPDWRYSHKADQTELRIRLYRLALNLLLLREQGALTAHGQIRADAAAAAVAAGIDASLSPDGDVRLHAPELDAEYDVVVVAQDTWTPR